ncbi:hypothetical protein SELMODRAFT_447967 [Selaginella moellendorffii]|uniref:CHY-type domain-containing protein n=1 Tax=Selaginella moellendorffii TaxID=88036 RepID=D8T3T8_SELML|nr:hypothetical protein SELMODRAFT_447967 [Selaginella moellendorffii]
MALELDGATGSDESAIQQQDRSFSRESLPPMFVIVYFHKAIRLELERIHETAMSMDRSSGQDFRSLAERYNFLREIYEHHSQAEDEVIAKVILPALESRVKNVARSYCLEHVVENDLLNEMSQLLSTHLGDQTDSSWQEIISCTEAVQRTVCQHLSKEEGQVIPLLMQYYNREEQASLVWQFMGNIPVKLMEIFLPWLASSLTLEECKHMELCFREIVPAEELLQEVITEWFKRDHSKFRLGANRAPKTTPKPAKQAGTDVRFITRSPLNDLLHWHQAIKRELLNITEEIKDLTSLATLSERMEFVSKVWSFHSAAEDKFVFPPIGKKLDHAVQDEVCSEALRVLENTLKNNCSSTAVITQAELLLDAVEAHFSIEETEFLPLASKLFSIDEQRTLVYESLKTMPLVFLRRVLPWIVNCVTAKEAKDMLVNIRLAAPQGDSILVALLTGWACENHSHVWDLLKNESLKVSGKRSCQLAADRPSKLFRSELSLLSKSLQLEPDLKGSKRSTGKQQLKPIDQIFQFHKAIRKDLEYLDVESARLLDCTDEFLGQFRGRFYFLWGLYRAHSSAEDTIVFPALEAKEALLNVSHSYMIDHRQEEDLFNEISAILSTFSSLVTQSQEKTEGDEAHQHFLAAKLQRMCKSMRICLGKHVDREESELWPLFDKHFSVQEQDKVMARIIGSTGAEVIQAMLPWVTAVLTEEERNSMMETWEQATRNTLFQDWLSAWWTAPSTSRQRPTKETSVSTKDCLQSLVEYFSEGKDTGGDTRDDSETFKPGWPEIFRLNQEELEAAVRKLSTDASLDPRRKAYLMQNLMTCRWMVAQQKLRDQRLTDSEPAPSYADEENKVFGCKHYRRNCKLRAACCGSLFTCRLCHDEASDHTMDRYQTSEMLCMQCLKVQPVGPNCTTPSCNRFCMARYYCPICKFFDDDSKRSIYHCPFCNICRVGSGLGQEFFHCLVCNGCMSKTLEQSHICREKGTETDCPICCEQIFSSVPDVKSLPCGHYMHSSCFLAYSSNHYTCPICCKTLGDMGLYFGLLDALMEAEQLPEEYRGRKETIFCNDCERKGEAQFHWLYHKCGACGSFNTKTI